VVHRDLKPANILVSERPGGKLAFRVTDFGIGGLAVQQAVAQSKRGTDSGQFLASTVRGAYTPLYASPQQMRGTDDPDPRDDVYALGVIWYQLLTGDLMKGRPGGEAWKKRLAERGMPAPLLTLLASSYEEEREDRPANSVALAEKLGHALQGPTEPEWVVPPEVLPVAIPVAPPPSPQAPRGRDAAPPPAVPAPKRRRKWGVVLAGLLAALLVSLGLLLIHSFTGGPNDSRTEGTSRGQEDKNDSFAGGPSEGGNKGTARQREDKERPQPAKGEEHRPKEVKQMGVSIAPGIEMKFDWVPSGVTWLGGGGGKPGTYSFTLKEGLWCGVYPVTQAEWQAVMGDNPSQFKGNPRYPVESVSWDRVQEFLKKLNQRKQGEGLLYRLPTSDELEYICRGGALSKEQSNHLFNLEAIEQSKYHFYFARSRTDLTPAPSNDLSHTQANFDNKLAHPSDVGSYVPNPLGIYDLHGNVWQWTDTVDEGGLSRLVRGGSWHNGAAFCAASYGVGRAPDIAYDHLGFRLLAVPSSK
jgi:serine/threonine protein kinase